MTFPAISQVGKSMTMLKGTMNYTRFAVRCDTALTDETIIEKLNLYRFRPLHPRGEDLESFGWCPFEHEFEDEKSIGPKDCLFDDKLVLSLRIDTLRFPKSLLKSLVKRSLRAYQQDFNKIPDRIAKKEIERAEEKGLRQRMLPKTQVIESIWCRRYNELRIFSRSKTLVDRYRDHFKQTFMVKPEPRDFVAEALNFSQGNTELNIDTISHQTIFTPPLRTDVL
jgi:hypothetical protein